MGVGLDLTLFCFYVVLVRLFVHGGRQAGWHENELFLSPLLLLIFVPTGRFSLISRHTRCVCRNFCLVFFWYGIIALR